MKTARRCLLLASLALAGCASTPSGGLPADAGLRVEPVRPARASLSGVHLDASGRVLSGWIRSGYPDLPRDRQVRVTLPSGEELIVTAPRPVRTQRHERPVRARFEVELP
ncbi:MAG: hypothetical protein H6828_00855 [Planctomycetes bacterium]|nr:hypothetical protein [Planctomycetota bacterium]